MKKLLVLLLTLIAIPVSALAADIGIKYGNTSSTQASTVTSTTTSTGPIQATNINIQGSPAASWDGSTLNVDFSNLAGAANAASYTATGSILFQSSMVASGSPAASTQVATSSTNPAPANLPFSIIYKNVSPGAGSLDASPGTLLPNGVPGQVLRLVTPFVGGSGKWLITPITATGWSAASMSASGSELRLTYVNNTIGWVVDSTIGTVTITYPAFSGN